MKENSVPIGFSVRIMPGVRISASTRGIRVGLGPRAARLNVGSGGTSVSSSIPGMSVSASRRGVRAGFGPQAARVNTGSGGTSFSTGFGPFVASTGGNRARPSFKTYERDVRHAHRAQEISEIARLEQRLVTAHLEEFPEARPPQAPTPTPVDRVAIHKRFREEALRGVSLFAWSARRAARREAEQQAEDAICEEELREAEARAEELVQLDFAWQSLITNDPQTVLAVLEKAFEDNQAPAAPVNCEGDEATIFMLYDSPDSVPDQKPALTPSGYPTLHRRSYTERNELYAAVLASRVLVTAKEAFAVAPGINRVVALVMRKEELPAPARPVLSCLYCGRFERERFERIDWTSVDPLEEIARTPGALIERKWRTAEVAPLNLFDAPDLATVLHTTADVLGCDANVYRRHGTNRSASTRGVPSPTPPASERVPLDSGPPFEELTLRALDRARELPEVYGGLLALLEGCRPPDPPVLEQQRGAAYKQLAHIGYLIGMDKAERSGWYRIAKSIPLTELHALHIIDVLKRVRRPTP